MMDNRKKSNSTQGTITSVEATCAVWQTVTEIKQEPQVTVQHETRRQSWSLFSTFLIWILQSLDELEDMTLDD